jgi:hypothetical protein
MDPAGGHLPRDNNDVPAIGGFNTTSLEVEAPTLDDTNKALYIAGHVWDITLMQWVKMQQPDLTGVESLLAGTYWPDERYAYDGSHNMIYIGKNLTMGEPEGNPTWYVWKLTYSGTDMVRHQGPLLGSWTGRAGLGW